MPKPKTYGLTHIAIAVKDLRRTLIFYQKVFDVQVMYQQNDFLQVTTPGSHDILVFEKRKAVYGNTYYSLWISSQKPKKTLTRW